MNKKTPRNPKGAGRKPISGLPLIKIPVTIRQDQGEWLTGKNRSAVVREALDRLIESTNEK
jgi:hypothetical protein